MEHLSPLPTALQGHPRATQTQSIRRYRTVHNGQDHQGVSPAQHPGQDGGLLHVYLPRNRLPTGPRRRNNPPKTTPPTRPRHQPHGMSRVPQTPRQRQHRDQEAGWDGQGRRRAAARDVACCAVELPRGAEQFAGWVGLFAGRGGQGA